MKSEMVRLARAHYPEEGSHGFRTHVLPVLGRALAMNGLRARPLDRKLVVAAVLFHDSALSTTGRKGHETAGAEIARQELAGILAPARLDAVCAAIREHRASYDGSFTSDLSDLLSSADRNGPSVREAVRRAVEYRLEHGEELGPDSARNAAEHLRDKYGSTGYARVPWHYRAYWGARQMAFQSAMDALTPEGVLAVYTAGKGA